MAETWTVLKVLSWTTERFERAELDSPRLDAQVLLAHVLGCDRVSLYTSFDKPLARPELEAYRGLIQRRLAGEPVAYLVGEMEFWGRPFRVDGRVLVPRRDTETLIEAVLDRCPDRDAERRIADVGTGSGIIAITLAAELPGAHVIATDASADALAVARANVERHHVEGRVELRHGSLLEPLGGEAFDLLVANLPYVAEGDLAGLAPEVRAEPPGALAGGPDGLSLIRPLVAGASAHLRTGGLVVLEHGYDQGAAVRQLMTEHGLAGPRTLSDLGGNDRVTLAQVPAPAMGAE